MRHPLFFTILLLTAQALRSQSPDTPLTLSQALRIAVTNYPKIKAAENIVGASALEMNAAKQDGLPDLTVGIQTAYGTLDGSNGLSNGMPGLTSITGGQTNPTQNWQAAFGAMYLANIDWNLFSFGLQRAHVAAALGQYDQDKRSLEQQIFQQQVKVAGAYLSLLAAVHVRMAMESNLTRTLQLRDVILARTINGLNPGVDSSIANAEVSKARLSLIDARNFEQIQANRLSTQMGIRPQSFTVDTAASQTLPKDLLTSPGPDLSTNPSLRFLASQVYTSNLFADYIRKEGLPRFLLFAAGQDRGSGFGNNYATNPADFTTSPLRGIEPYRANYLIGVGVIWDITSLGPTRTRAAAQQQRSAAFANEYQLEQNNLINQLALSDQQIRNALEKYRETPVQLQAATDAYAQKTALYANGLTNIVDVSQTLYLLNRAEIDRDIACNAIWQALLFKAGTLGDLTPFLQQF
ncbi:MAG TPA: TolC family protein [Puia sp.]|jgi:outer membrane protein TolC|nr:TolC family protein [Puia sp.]